MRSRRYTDAELDALSDEELDAIIGGMPQVSTVGQDLRDLGQMAVRGVKALPSAAKKVAGSALRHPGQAAAGIVPGLASIGDLPAFVGNIGLGAAEYAGRKLTGNPEFSTPTLPYMFSAMGTEIADLVAGEPQTEAEQQARFAGELGSAFINPARVAQRIGQKGISKVSAINPEKYESFASAGLTPTLGEVSNSKPVMSIEEGLKRFPGGAGVYEKAAKTREQELDNLFSEYLKPEKSVTASEAGELTKKGAYAYNEKATGIANKLYDKAWGHISEKTPIPLEKTRSAIDEALSAITIQAREKLQNTKSGKAFIELESAIKANNGALPLSDLKKVYRPALDDLITTWGEVGTKEQGVLKDIRRTLDAETKQFITHKNPEAAKDFAKADKFWSQFSERNKKLANSIIKSESPVDIFNQGLNAIKKGDSKKAAVLSNRLNAEGKEVLSSTWMQELGRNSAGEFDANKWAKEFLKIENKSPESAKILTAGLPERAAGKLVSIAKSLGHSKISRGQANHSGTAYTAALFGALPGLLYAPGTTAAAFASSHGASKLFTSPKFIDGLYAASKTKTPMQLEKVLSKYTALPRIEVLREQMMRKEEDILLQSQPQASQPSFTDAELDALSDAELDALINQP